MTWQLMPMRSPTAPGADRMSAVQLSRLRGAALAGARPLLFQLVESLDKLACAVLGNVMLRVHGPDEIGRRVG